MPEAKLVRLALEEDLYEVVQRLAETFDVPIDAAAAIALRDWAVGAGYLTADAFELEEDTPTEGTA